MKTCYFYLIKKKKTIEGDIRPMLDWYRLLNINYQNLGPGMGGALLPGTGIKIFVKSSCLGGFVAGTKIKIFVKSPCHPLRIFS